MGLPRLILLTLLSLSACQLSPTADHATGSSQQLASSDAPSSEEPARPQTTASTASTATASPSSKPETAGDERRATPAEPPDGMLLVPGGIFAMGQDSLGELDERPSHEVEVGSFYLDKTEVTNADYRACVEAKLCEPRDSQSASRNKLGEDKDYRGPKQPVSAIRWDDAAAYCAFVGKRLPTEAEWERAARGDDGRRYPWGDSEPTPKHAVFSTAPTADVGTHPEGAGPYGHLDLAGNVWEWVSDNYDPYAYRRATSRLGKPGSCDEILKTQDELRKNNQQGFTGSNPIPTECERVLRGGAFNYPGKGLRSSNRVHHPGRMRLIMAGFRCAKDLQ